MKTFSIKKLTAFLLVASSLFAFTACGTKSPTSTPAETPATSETPAEAGEEMSPVMKRVKESGKLILGTSADYPPYEFHKSINGKDEIVGFDIEVAREIAKDLGVTLEIKDMKFDGLLAALDQGVIDLVVAGMSPTPERAKSVDFSDVYYQSKQMLVVRAEDKDIITSKDAMSGKTIGVQKGAIQETIAAEQFSTSTPMALGKISDLVLALKSKRVDAAIIEYPVALANTNANPDLFMTAIEIPMESEGTAAAMKKGNPDFVESVNKTLERLISEKLIEQFVADANALVEQE
ncbi:MAG: transporter substrate-binding domain-containing protein [Clostridiaceae bacterium]